MGTYKIGIYNPQNILQGTISDGTYAIKYSPLENQATSSVSSSSPYIKISNSGAVSPDTAMLGSSQNNWGCTKDKKTGLIWEIKTTDDGLRDTIKVYTYPQAKKFVDNVNTQMLCGYSNWRIPTYRELYTLVGSSKTIDPTYFQTLKMIGIGHLMEVEQQ